MQRRAREGERRPGADGRRADGREIGTGLIGSLAGVTVFLVLMLLAVQVLFDLYARSAVSAAAFDAARRVAGYDLASLPPDQLLLAEAGAEARARQVLGRYGARTRFSWTLTPTDVELRVRVVNPSLLPPRLAGALSIDAIDRTVRVRAERLVCPSAEPCRASGATPAAQP